MLGYAFAGKGPLFALHWSFANGLMGLIPGLAGRFGARPVDSILSFVKLLLLLLLASALPFALSTGVEVGLGRVAFHNALFSLFLPIFITDTLWAFMLVPPLMQLFGLLIARVEIRTIQAVYYLLIVMSAVRVFSGLPGFVSLLKGVLSHYEKGDAYPPAIYALDRNIDKNGNGRPSV